jgi:hypothetical protein
MLLRLAPRGYSERIVVDEDFVLKVSSKARPRAKVSKGQRVGIVGLGELGHMGVKLARALGGSEVAGCGPQVGASDSERMRRHDLSKDVPRGVRGVSWDSRATESAVEATDWVPDLQSTALPRAHARSFPRKREVRRSENACRIAKPSPVAAPRTSADMEGGSAAQDPAERLVTACEPSAGTDESAASQGARPVRARVRQDHKAAVAASVRHRRARTGPTSCGSDHAGVPSTYRTR